MWMIQTMVLLACMGALSIIPAVTYHKGIEVGMRMAGKPTADNKASGKRVKAQFDRLNHSKELERYRKIAQNIDRYDGSAEGQVTV